MENVNEPGPKFVMIQVTGDNETLMDQLAENLVNNKLAACVNIVPSIKSYYLEDGVVQNGQEILLIIKSTFNLMDEIINFIEKNHHYNTCEIIAFEIVKGNKKYFNWIARELH